MGYEKFTNGEEGVTILKNKISYREILLAALGILLTVCALGICLALIVHHGTTEVVYVNKTESCMSTSCLGAAATIAAFRNPAAEPCDDFYQYACGNWAKYETKAEIDPDKQDETIFSFMEKRNEERLLKILEDPEIYDQVYEAKVKNFFHSCTAEWNRTQIGAKPMITKILQPAGGWNAIDPAWSEANYDISDGLKKVHVDFWKNALFRIKVQPDRFDNTMNVIAIDLGGLTLYWWDYTYTDEWHQNLFNATKTFMSTVADLMIRDSGVDMTADARQAKAREFAEDVFTFESHLANNTWFSAPSDDPHAHDNRIAIKDMHATADSFDWEHILLSMFDTAGITRDTTVVMLEGNYLSKINTLIKSLPNAKRTLNNYFTWRLMQGYLVDLGWEYIHANRVWYVQRTGLSEFLGVPKYCYNKVQHHFSDALGALYIRDHLLQDDKDQIDEIIRYLKQGLADRLKAVPWMDEPTRKIAIEKSAAITERIGYPDWMTDNDHLDKQYQQLSITKTDYLSNLISVANYDRSIINMQLKSGVDRNDWRFKVYDTHGMYDNWWNELLVPAGLLQWPVFGKGLPKLYNFGSLGVNLGHELVLAVDEIGGYYLKNGTYFDWWSKNTTNNYNVARKCLESLNITAGPYKDTPTSLPRNVTIDGAYVARELIAETAAVKFAYQGYLDWTAANQREKILPGLGLTDEQAMFLAYAQTQCFVRRDPYSLIRAERQILPENLRVNLALAHTPQFVKAFNCPVGSRMNAPKKCEVF